MQTKLYIDGELTDGLAGRTVDVINPADPRRAALPAAESQICQDEVFGPVVTVSTFSTEAEAIAIANGTEYGLGGGLWTADLSRAHRVAAALRSGMVWVNCYKRVNPGSPFGGTGKSGYGREMGFAAMDEYTTRKSVWINVDATLPDWYAR